MAGFADAKIIQYVSSKCEVDNRQPDPECSYGSGSGKKRPPDPRLEVCLKLAGPAQVVQDDRQLLPGLQFDSRRGS